MKKSLPSRSRRFSLECGERERERERVAVSVLLFFFFFSSSFPLTCHRHERKRRARDSGKDRLPFCRLYHLSSASILYHQLHIFPPPTASSLPIRQSPSSETLLSSRTRNFIDNLHSSPSPYLCCQPFRRSGLISRRPRALPRLRLARSGKLVGRLSFDSSGRRTGSTASTLHHLPCHLTVSSAFACRQQLLQQSDRIQSLRGPDTLPQWTIPLLRLRARAGPAASAATGLQSPLCTSRRR